MLTDRFVKTASAGMHADGNGLYLRVSPKGKRVWVTRAQLGGKDTWKTIGVYPGMSLATAREKPENKPEVVTTEAAIKAYIAKINVKRPEQVTWLMNKFPDLYAERTILVHTLQTKAATRPVMANRMLSRWKDFLNFCVQQGWLQSNVLEPVQRRFVGGKEHSRNRVLSWDEVKAITDPTLHFILLTGLRPSEAIYALRCSQTGGIPTKRQDYKHTLPKSHLIHLFMKSFTGAIPASHLTLSNRLRRAAETYRPHDLRRTYATKISELGVMPHIVEKLLGHKMPGVMAVYNHAEYWPERNAAQRLWDKKLIALWRTDRIRGGA